MEVPLDSPLFRGNEATTFMFVLASNNESSGQFSASHEAKLVSDAVSVSIRTVDSTIDDSSLPSGVYVSEVPVRKLPTPIKIRIPVAGGAISRPESTACVFFDEDLGSWQLLENMCEKSPDLDRNTLLCCTDHLTKFAIQEFPVVEQLSQNGGKVTSIGGSRRPVPGSPSFMGAHIYFIATLTVLLIGLILLGMCLDK